MVAAVTQLDTEFIEWHLPLAKGLQYQALWLDLRAREDQLHGFIPRFTRRAFMTRSSTYIALAG